MLGVLVAAGVLLFARGTCFKGWVWNSARVGSTGEKHHLYLRNVHSWAPDLNCYLYAHKVARWFAWTFGFERPCPELDPVAPAAREHGNGCSGRGDNGVTVIVCLRNRALNYLLSIGDLFG